MEKEFLVPPAEACAWFQQNIFGGVRRKDLDGMRFKEIGSTDMIYGIPIVYHSESISEMQIFCLLATYFLHGYFGPGRMDELPL